MSNVPCIFSSSRSLPDGQELREILSYLNCNDREVWFKTFAILGRAYNRDSRFLEIGREWSRGYSERKESTDSKQEETEFYKSSLHNGPGIGALIVLAKANGYRKTHYDNFVREEKSPCSEHLAQHKEICLQDPKVPLTGDMERLLKNVNLTAGDALGYWLFYATPDDDQLRIKFLTENQKYFRFMPPRYRLAYSTLLDYCCSHSKFTVNDFKAWCTENELALTPESIMSFAHVNTKVDSPERTWDQLETMYRNAWVLLSCQQAQEYIDFALAANSFEAVIEARQNAIERTMEVSKAPILEPKDFEAAVKREIASMRDIYGENSRFISTGFPAIDSHILGFHRGFVTLFAAHSGVGKTWFGVDSSLHLIQEGSRRVLFISSEMEPDAVITRYFGALNDFSLKDVFGSKVPDNILDFAYKNLDTLTRNNAYLRILGNTGTGLSIDDIEAEVASCSAVHPLDLIVVDYLQNINNDHLGHNATGFERHKDTMQRLDRLARRYNCAVLALAQLNNPNRKQGTYVPNLYDIAECTYVVHPADSVLMMYKVASPIKAQAQELKLVVTKSRYGSPSETPLQVSRSAGGRFVFFS